MPKYTEAQLKHAFEAFDTDRNGYIDVKEIENLVVNRLNLSGGMADRVCKCIMAAHDLNKDSKLSYTEFKKGVGPYFQEVTRGDQAYLRKNQNGVCGMISYQHGIFQDVVFSSIVPSGVPIYRYHPPNGISQMIDRVHKIGRIIDCPGRRKSPLVLGKTSGERNRRVINNRSKVFHP